MLSQAQERAIGLATTRPDPDPVAEPEPEVTLEELAARVEALERVAGVGSPGGSRVPVDSAGQALPGV